ncbi:MAG: anaerobic ribonucleoside-triphosphate reductase activating protein [Ruminiclostridium sp.]|nr:anaerobic ribonucleoside-triphosphate reductase activating protein [Ruminiclostridium sp.]
MYYGEIKNYDIANGSGVRVTLFVSGCTNHCEGCFQPETWDFRYGRPFTPDTEKMILDMLAPDYINGLTVLGGEPFEPDNQRILLPFLSRVKEKYPCKSIWIFSGYTYDEMKLEGSRCRCECTDSMLGLADILVDGRFVIGLKDISLRFRGSSNQRIIDLAKTRETGTLTLWKDKLYDR